MARLIDEVRGQQVAWELLERQRRSGHLPHALAFVGPSGVGKKQVAWAFAQALLCEGPLELSPCGECPACRRVAHQQSEAVLFQAPQNGTLKLEAAQAVLQFLNLRRLARARIVIFDDAQLFNPQAGNALLKAVEDPPEQTYFLFIVNEWTQLLPTLRSRLQVVRFVPLADAELRVGAEPPPEWMVRSARGSLEKLAQFRDLASDELRQLVVQVLAEAWTGRRTALDNLLDRVRDREAAFTAVQFLQEILRDWNVPSGVGGLHPDLASSLSAFPNLRPERKHELWAATFRMEQDLVAHVDRGLIFENFYLRAKTAVAN